MTQYVKDTFAFITGASKGIGKSIAIEFSKHLKTDCTVVILALPSKDNREATVEVTKSEILKINPRLNVITSEFDLSITDKNTYKQIFNKALSNRKANYENAIIFHNAGSIGELNETTKLTNLNKWRSYYDLNLFSTALLNSVFLEKILNKAQNVTIVNMTSICGTQPFKNLSMYGSAKAARNLFFKVLSKENPDVKVLNYSPGPVDTDMVGDIIANVKDAEVKSIFTGLKEQKTILIAEQTVGKMIKILEKNEFKSGDIIDYYGRI